MSEKQNEKFTYAHNDTSCPERESRTSSLNRGGVALPPGLERIRQSAYERDIPVSSEETLAFLCTCAAMAKPERILEIGTAIGASGIAMLSVCGARLTTVERNADFAAEAKRNFEEFALCDRVELIVGDAAEVLPALDGKFDFIFLDGPKAQYVKYLPRLKDLLSDGGALFADDVLLYGWVNGEKPTPPKRRMLVEHIREYLEAVRADPDLLTTVADVGDGVALSVKRKTAP